MSDPAFNANPKPRIEASIDGQPVVITPSLEAALLRAERAASSPLPKEMTTTQAADFLDVSRPFVIKLIKKGELPCRMVGKHRRIPSEALVQYRKEMCQRASHAADEMTRLAQEAGLYAAEVSPGGK
jgi:excisionase family DNA binding protein